MSALASAMLLGSAREGDLPAQFVALNARSALGGSARCSQSPMAAWERGDDGG